MKKELFSIFSIGFLIFSGKTQTVKTVTFNSEKAVQNWTVPCGVKQITIQATGAAGGSYYNINYFSGSAGGNGASVTGTCAVIPGENLSIVAGAIGGSITTTGGNGAAGGGCSLVYDSVTLNLFIAAGGGGGGDGSPLNFNGGNGGTDLITNLSTKGIGAGTIDSSGGTAGNGGMGGDSNYGGAGGAGWLSNGGNVKYGIHSISGGGDRIHFFMGGKDSIRNINGGYGGGGAAGDGGGGGGGGGYNGGGGGWPNKNAPGGGGGGGSYLNGTVVGIPSATNTGNGYVTITYTINPIQITIDSINDNGGCIGDAWVKVSGGTPPYLYSWSDGQTTDTAVNLCAGTYTCYVSDSNNCPDSASVEISFVTASKNIAATNSKAIVYPNPNNGEFSIQNKGGAAKLEVYNILGQRVLSNALNSGNNNIKLYSPASGLYLYRIFTKTGNLVTEGKFVVTK